MRRVFRWAIREAEIGYESPIQQAETLAGFAALKQPKIPISLLFWGYYV